MTLVILGKRPPGEVLSKKMRQWLLLVFLLIYLRRLACAAMWETVWCRCQKLYFCFLFSFLVFPFPRGVSCIRGAPPPF